MSGSNGRCCTSEPDRLTLDGPVEEDGFITVVATGWTRPGAAAADPERDPKPPAPSDSV